MDQTTLALQQQLRDSMDDEIATRIKVHQTRIASIRTAAASRMAAGATPPVTPLVMLAHGDSWFNYPLNGNGPLLAGPAHLSRRLNGFEEFPLRG